MLDSSRSFWTCCPHNTCARFYVLASSLLSLLTLENSRTGILICPIWLICSLIALHIFHTSICQEIFNKLQRELWLHLNVTSQIITMVLGFKNFLQQLEQAGLNAESSINMTLLFKHADWAREQHSISVSGEAYILGRLPACFFKSAQKLRESFIASEVCNQSAIWSVMFNDSSKHRFVVSGTCGHLLKLLESTLCGDKKKAQ